MSYVVKPELLIKHSNIHVFDPNYMMGAAMSIGGTNRSQELWGQHLVDFSGGDDPKLRGYSGEVPIYEWSGWQFDSCCEIFSILDRKKKLAKQVGSQEPTHCKAGSKPHHAPRGVLSRVGPTSSNSCWIVRRWLFIGGAHTTLHYTLVFCVTNSICLARY